jgi:hypothetical protein
MSRVEPGSSAVTLKELAAQGAFLPPPYDFDEFTRRNVRARRERRVLTISAAASVAALAVLVSVALHESAAPSLAQSMVVPTEQDAGSAMASGSAEPALVEVDRYGLRSDLEDRIAWFDAALSTGRVEAVPDEALLQMESTRAQLAQSLQHVTYAHALLDY